MTPEAAREALTEKMVAAWRQAANDYAGDDMECMDALCAQAAIESVLSARVVDDCPTCEGRGWIPFRGDSFNKNAQTKCAECVEGKRYGPLLVTVATMEQVGFAWKNDEGAWFVNHKHSPYDRVEPPVFVESPGEEQ